jgi:hypothetical protein
MTRRRNRENNPNINLRPMTEESDPETGTGISEESIGEEDE